MTRIDRRTFIGRGAAVAASGVMTSVALERLQARAASASPQSGEGLRRSPARRRGRHGRSPRSSRCPAGFSYVVFGKIGSTMTDGNPTPLALDGMAAFRGLNGQVRLIRNHEDRNPPGIGSVPTGAGAYDAAAHGGTSTLDYDPRNRRLVRDYVEPVGDDRQLRRRLRPRPAQLDLGRGDDCGPRGVPPARSTMPSATATRSRSRWTARSASPRARCHLWRWAASPTKPWRPTSATASCIRPRMLAPDRAPASTATCQPTRMTSPPAGACRCSASIVAPTPICAKASYCHRSLRASWVDIEDPDPAYPTDNPPGSTFNQGRAGGGALFNRLEGCW